jgi:hypothetical protein
VVAIGFGNPWLAHFVAHSITGVTTYQRVFWLLPVAVGLGSSCAALLGRLERGGSRNLAAAVTGLAVAAFLALATERRVISEENQARLEFPPALKLWAHARLVAEHVCKWGPRGEYVLAPQGVSLQLPMLSGCGYPLATFDRWLSAPDDEKQLRNDLVHYVSERDDVPKDRAGWFIDALAREHVDVVLLSHEAARNPRVKSLIRAADFEHAATFDWDHVFIRTRPVHRAAYANAARAVCRAAPAGGALLAPFGLSEEIDKLGCARVLTTPARVHAATPGELDQLLSLERATYRSTEPSHDEQTYLSSAVGDRGVATIVLASRTKTNRKLKTALGQLGFGLKLRDNGFAIFVRDPEDAAP